MTLAELTVLPDVAVLHERRVPGCPAPIGQLWVGPGGVTVVGTDPVRRRDPVSLRGLVTAAERHVDLVEACLVQWGAGDVDVRGCLCPADLAGSSHPFAGLRVGAVPLLDPAGVARLARRPGALPAGRVTRLAELLHAALPSTAR